MHAAAKTEISALDQSAPRKMLSEEEVLEIVPVSRSTLYRMERAGTFPRGKLISPNRKVWFQDVIVGWQKSIAENDPHYNPNRGRGKGRQRVSASTS